MIFPVADLYDSGMMQMYINAAREQYNQGRQDMKEFIDKYGDFVSPFQEDMNWVDNETRGRVNNALNYLYQNGIDPLRSAEGRALIQRVINNTDRAGINARRQSAENKRAWDKLAGEMKAKGQYNNDFINWYFSNKYGITPDQWSTEKNGVFSETSPQIYQDLNQYTGHIFDKMEDQFIGSDGQFDYSGVSEARRREALTPQLRGLTSTDLGRYHYELARQDAARKLGRVPTEDEVMQQYQDNIITSTKEYERRKREENKEYARARDYYYDNKLDAAKDARDLNNYLIKAGADTDGDGRLSQLERAAYAAQFGATDDGNGNSSTGSGNKGDESAQGTMGTADQAQWEQNYKYLRNREDFVQDYSSLASDAYKEQKRLYSNLSGQDKKVAVQYGKAWRTYYNSKSSDADRRKAQATLERCSKKRDANFIAWKNQFEKRMSEYSNDPNYMWTKRSTTEGLADFKPQTPVQLRKRARMLYEKNNVITGDLTNEQKLELNKSLGYSQNTKDADARDGKMNDNRDLKCIIEADLTGGRFYRYNSVPSVVSRLLKGKSYTVERDDVVGREYSAGDSRKGRNYIVIGERAKFSDSEVYSKLAKMDQEKLKAFGIERAANENAYYVEIGSKIGHGQARAEINNASDKRGGGQSDAAKRRPTRQAAEITNQLKELNR